MPVTTTNLIQGPATLYVGAFGAAEPTDALINTAPAAAPGRTSAGRPAG
jgi:hypothetical protein